MRLVRNSLAQAQKKSSCESFESKTLVKLKARVGIGIAGGELEVEAHSCREAVETLKECLEIIGTGIAKAPIHGITKLLHPIITLAYRRKKAAFFNLRRIIKRKR